MFQFLKRLLGIKPPKDFANQYYDKYNAVISDRELEFIAAFRAWPNEPLKRIGVTAFNSHKEIVYKILSLLETLPMFTYGVLEGDANILILTDSNYVAYTIQKSIHFLVRKETCNTVKVVLI